MKLGTMSVESTTSKGTPINLFANIDPSPNEATKILDKYKNTIEGTLIQIHRNELTGGGQPKVDDLISIRKRTNYVTHRNHQ